MYEVTDGKGSHRCGGSKKSSVPTGFSGDSDIDDVTKPKTQDDYDQEMFAANARGAARDAAVAASITGRGIQEDPGAPSMPGSARPAGGGYDYEVFHPGSNQTSTVHVAGPPPGGSQQRQKTYPSGSIFQPQARPIPNPPPQGVQSQRPPPPPPPPPPRRDQ
jgi:hypothetical protein